MKYTHRTIYIGLVIIVVSLLPLWDLLHPGLPVTHDGQDHVARIANFYASLSEGNLVPRWAANLNWGYGHPILMFLYPFPSYIASLFHAIGFSFVDSTKLVLAVSYIASIGAMFLWISAAWGGLAGLTAAILYGFAPYRFVDLYVRGAIGEHMAFVFPPLICYGLHRRNYWLVSIGTALLILSHNALSIMFLPLIVLYAVYLATITSKKPVQYFVFCLWFFVLGFLLSGFYWIPAFFEGKYTLRDIVTAGEFSGRFVPWISFLYSRWSYGGGNELSKWLGAGGILVLLASIAVLEKAVKYRRFILAVLLLLFFTLFMMTDNSEIIWQTVTVFQKFQFPWRFMSVVVFLLSLLGAVTVVATEKKYQFWVSVSVVILSVLSTVPMWRAREYKTYPESYFTDIYNSTTDTGESSPIWSVRFMESRPEGPAYLVPASGTIIPGKRTTIERNYHISVSDPVRFVENTLYFPGWQVSINGDVLPLEKLMFQDPAHRGLMTMDLTPGEYDIRFSFTNTKLRRVSEYISIGAFILFMASIVTIHMLWRKK